MADWTDLGTAFGANEILTSNQMQQLRDNITAAFEQASGAPLLTNSYVNSSMVGSGQIGTNHVAAIPFIGNDQIKTGSIKTNQLNIELIYKVSKLIFTDGTMSKW